MYYKCTACSECFMNEDTFFAHTRTWHCKILLCQGQNPAEEHLMCDYLPVEANTETEQTQMTDDSCPGKMLEEKSLSSGQGLAAICCAVVKEEPYTMFNIDESSKTFDETDISAITQQSSWMQANLCDVNSEIENKAVSSANVYDGWLSRDAISTTTSVTAVSSSIINMEIVNSCNLENTHAEYPKFQSESSHEDQISKASGSFSSLTQSENTEKPVCFTNNSETSYVTSNIRSKLKQIPRTSNKKPKIYKCDECGKEFFQNSRYWQHVREHRGPIIRAHKCNECGTTFTDAAELTSHRKLHERSFKLNVCNVCGSGFHSIDELVQHIMTHTVPSHLPELATKTPEKTICKPSYRARRNKIKRHSLSPYECGICQTTFCHPRKLVAHFRYHNSNSYKCEKCLVAFQTMAELIRHNKIHTGDKQYKCNVCGAAFVQSGNLVLHKRKHVKQ